MTRPVERTVPPRWIQFWLAGLPVMYVISPFALLALPALRQLPRAARWALGIYALSQQVPALFAPEPLLGSALALARTLLMFGLIGIGVWLAHSQHVRSLGWGLFAACVTALVFTLLGRSDLLSQRLSHPYMTPVALGLAGAFSVWLALLTGGKLIWRLPLGLLGLGILLLSGSRGPLAAALVGCVAAFAVRQGRRVALALVAGVALLAGGFYAGQKLDVAAITRLGNADTTGRDIVWYNTLSVIHSEPWSGVGSYRLGSRLAPPDGNCELFPSATGDATVCPDWIDALDNFWLIAHNVSLHQLAETGPLGVLGLFLLIGAVAVAAVQTRESLAVAVVSGLLVATANDNTLLVPSPFFAEVFWVVAGTQLARLQTLGVGTGVLTAGLMLTLSFPILVSALRAPQRTSVTLTLLSAPTIVQGSKAYKTFVQVAMPSGEYRAVLRGCLTSCSTISVLPFNVTNEPGKNQTSSVLLLSGNLHSLPRQRLELLLYPGIAGTRIQPLARRVWTVVTEP